MSPPQTNANYASAHVFSEKLRRDYPMVTKLEIRPENLMVNKLDTPHVPSSYEIPNLLQDCPFKAHRNKYCDIVTPQSEEWFLSLAKYDVEQTKHFMGLKAGVLASFCYPYADEKHLRVVADYLNYLFNIDDWTDDYDVAYSRGVQKDSIGAYKDPEGFQAQGRAGAMCKRYWDRALETVGEHCNKRFIQNMDNFFEAVVIQSDDREKNIIPDLEKFIIVRRDTSGCYPCFQLEEYVGRFDLPDEVVNNKTIQRMEQSANDLVAFANDLFSYNKEQIRDDAHTMIPILMKHHHLDLQAAVNFVGDMCRQCMKNFVEDRDILPSFGEEVDKMVAKYADGLQNWMVGSMTWSFETERYFGKDGPMIKKTRIVELLPKVEACLPN